MQLDLEKLEEGNHIRGYTRGEIKVNESIYHQSLIVTPTQIIENWAPQTFSSLVSSDFTEIIKLTPEIVLLGTGPQHHFPTAFIMQPLIDNKINYEVMSTSAACRTYAILLADGRNVLTALILR